MFGLESGTRYFMCQHPVNMRKGIDSLFNLIVSESPMSPMAGDVFVFFSKNRQSVKLLKWDTDGFLLYQKRLERGSFEMPRKNAETGYYELSWETFNFIMSGVSLDSVRFRKRYRTRFLETR
jgi:transposase